MSIELSVDQSAALRAIVEWFNDSDRQSFTMGGLAGTGKTTIASVLPEMLPGTRIAYAAYTGKAASVLSKKLARKATTIHQLMYQPQEVVVSCDKFPECSKGDQKCRRCRKELVFDRIENMRDQADLVVVDEASMVSEEIYLDLMSYGVRVLWIGDHGQLPPVKGRFNLMETPDIRLEKIHRQAEDSPILKLAMHVRQEGYIPAGEIGPGVWKERGRNSSVSREEWASGEVMMLCGYNATRLRMNNSIREGLGFRDTLPEIGDRIVCLRNDHQKGIYNGMTATVVDVLEKDALSISMRVRMDNDGKEHDVRAATEQFGVKGTLMSVPRSHMLWDFGYALTVHKAQGSEAERVILLEEAFGTAEDRRRWLYTAVTRAKKTLEIH